MVLGIDIPLDVLDKWRRYMAQGFAEGDLPENATVACWTVCFGDGIECDLKVCTGKDGDAWCECVLFKNEACIEVSDCSDDLLGEWCFKLDGAEYIVDVRAVEAETEE